MVQPISALRLQTPQKTTNFYPNLPEAAPINYPKLFEDIKKRPEMSSVDISEVKKRLKVLKKQVQIEQPGYEYERRIQYSLRNYDGQTIFYFIPLVRNKSGNGDYLKDDVRLYFVDNPGENFTLRQVKLSDIKNSDGKPSTDLAQAMTTLRAAPRWYEKEKDGS